MSGAGREPLPEAVENECLAFAQQLTRELDAGPAQLPGVPAGALRVQCLLHDERTDPDQMSRAVSLEPALATMLLRIANSAAHHSGARPVQDVRVAVQRVGARMVQAATVALLLQQLRNMDLLRPVRERLQGLWRRGLAVGAIARVLTARVPVASGDTALLAGLLHVMGRLFVLTRLPRAPRLLLHPGAPERMMEEWGSRAGAALLGSWQVPAELVEVATRYDDPARRTDLPPGLIDVLQAAVILADLLPPSRSDYLDQMQLAQVHQQTEALWHRLGLSREACSDALHIALVDVQQLRATFGA